MNNKIIVCLSGCLLLSACSGEEPPLLDTTAHIVNETGAVKSESEYSTPVLSDKEGNDGVEKKNASSEQFTVLTECRQQLSVLKRFDPQTYARHKVSFDRLMSSAALYGDIRGELEMRTQGMVDSLYHYRVEKLCAVISDDVLRLLTQQVEQIK